MAAHRHVALLRGINVGGKNLISMADLRAAFEAAGFADVTTYIQSGNVVFSATSASKSRVTRAVEVALGDALGHAAPVVVLSASELAAVVAQAPPGFGSRADDYRYDVLFVKEPLTPAEVLPLVPTRAGVDTTAAGDHAVYFRRVTAQATRSLLPRLTQLPVYQRLTVRNWNTTTRLHALACGPG